MTIDELLERTRIAQCQIGFWPQEKMDLIIATGGSSMIQAALSSGMPAYGIGAGNAAVIVDETADLHEAAEKFYFGKTVSELITSFLIQKRLPETSAASSE